MENKFHLVVRSREGVVYNGDVTALTSKNEEGKFDILAEHANFISLINSLLEVRDLEGKVKELKIQEDQAFKEFVESKKKFKEMEGKLGNSLSEQVKNIKRRIS